MNPVYWAKPQANFENKLKQELRPLIKPKDRVAIKLHMGEPGNKQFLSPEFTKKIVKLVQEIGGEPFLFDSPVIYPSPRNSPAGYLDAAAKHGYSPANMGCPVVVTNDFVSVRLPEFKDFEFQVCKALVDADLVLILSHVKGHICSGFGGAIKNLGMGAMTKATKQAIHKGGEPKFVGECSLCGACVESCQLDNVRLDEEKVRPFFDKNWCCGCSDCVYACPNQALACNVDFFDRLLSGAAKAAVTHFKKYYCVNVALKIAKECDCMPSELPLIAGDVGTLLSRDIIAIERASLDLIVKKEGNDVFLTHNKKSPSVHIEAGEKMGMGSCRYELIAIE